MNKKLLRHFVCFSNNLNAFYKVLDEDKNYVLVEFDSGTFWVRKTDIYVLISSDIIFLEVL